MYDMDITNDMKYKTYIYGLYQDDKLIYVGKTCTPKERLIGHNGTYSGELHMVVLDVYDDLELLWVDKMRNKGHKLKNKEDNSSGVGPSLEIGDKVVLNPRKTKAIRDTELDILYPSLMEFQKATGISYGTILFQLTEAKNPKECYKKYVLEH